MSKQVLINNKWYDVSYIQQDGPTDRFVIVYQDNGSPRTTSLSSGWLRDKPEELTQSIDWDKPLQIKCGEEWYDVIFHKRYSNTISLIFEKYGDPVYVNENMDDFNVRDLTIRNKAPSLTFERWIIYSKIGIVHTCGSECEAQKRLLRLGREYKIKHIKVEWEL